LDPNAGLAWLKYWGKGGRAEGEKGSRDVAIVLKCITVKIGFDCSVRIF